MIKSQKGKYIFMNFFCEFLLRNRIKEYTAKNLREFQEYLNKESEDIFAYCEGSRDNRLALKSNLSSRYSINLKNIHGINSMDIIYEIACFNLRGKIIADEIRWILNTYNISYNNKNPEFILMLEEVYGIKIDTEVSNLMQLQNLINNQIHSEWCY